MAELLFEIGCEEMPARFVTPAMEQLGALATEALTAERMNFSGVKTMGTPRRLTLVVEELADQQPDFSEVVAGPPAKAAFDADGNATKAALGFAKSQGVRVADLHEVQTDKGPRLGFERHIPGRPTAELLPELLPRLVEKLHFPKTMRWGSGKFRFARPIHWFLALYDGKVVPFELAGIKSGDMTRGHRFLASDWIFVDGATSYVEKLKKAQVLVDRPVRSARCRQEVADAAQQAGGRLVPDEPLLEEVTDLVELPVAGFGSFDKEFLEVPRPVIISAMRGHQRYFALEDEQGRLLPAFVAVNNTRAKDPSVVMRGHERVLRARLSDAAFFLREDTRHPLIDFLDKLKNVTYHAKLGSSHEKVERVRSLAAYLAGRLAPELTQQVDRAASLAKCDLVTEMVGEFPELQGVVGADYARRCGEDPEVALAVAEHYMPTGADAPLPTGMIGTIVGLADRLDTLAGCFGVGLLPSGGADPYGLRRAAIAVLRVLTEKNLSLDLESALGRALTGLGGWLEGDPTKVKADLMEFFAARFTGLMGERGVPTDVAQAVLAAGFNQPAAALHRARALAAVKDSPDFGPLAAGLKRVMNILRKEAAEVPDHEPSADLLQDDAERELWTAFLTLRQEARERIQAEDYEGFLRQMSALKAPVDRFFEKVMVMAEDPAVRANRLALLHQVACLFRGLAEFTYLQL